MSAHGTSVTPFYASAWHLEVDHGWVTRSLSVSVHGRSWSRSLVLTHDGNGEWDAAVTSRGEAGLPAPGLTDPESLRGAIDCDLGLCPVTNTMPIRRLALNDHDVPGLSLVMAWVEMPTLRILRSEQVYASGLATAPGTVRYASSSGDFQAELTVDDDGVVIDYPQLARRLQIPD